jgi:hypothetical protein
VSIIGGDETESSAHGRKGPLPDHGIEARFVRHQGVSERGVFGLGEKYSVEEGSDKRNHVAIIEWEYGVEREVAREAETVKSSPFFADS